MNKLKTFISRTHKFDTIYFLVELNTCLHTQICKWAVTSSVHEKKETQKCIGFIKSFHNTIKCFG